MVGGPPIPTLTSSIFPLFSPQIKACFGSPQAMPQGQCGTQLLSRNNMLIRSNPICLTMSLLGASAIVSNTRPTCTTCWHTIACDTSHGNVLIHPNSHFEVLRVVVLLPKQRSFRNAHQKASLLLVGMRPSKIQISQNPKKPFYH